MGLFDFILGLFGWRSQSHSPAPAGNRGPSANATHHSESTPSKLKPRIRGRRAGAYLRLAPLRRQPAASKRTRLSDITVAELPYPFARIGVLGGYLDLSRDGDHARLAELGLPDFQDPAQLAAWIGISVGKLA